MNNSKKLIQKLLFKNSNKSKIWILWLKYSLGFSLVGILLIITNNFYDLLYNEKNNLNGTSIIISKQLNSENIGKPEQYGFSYADIRQIRNQENVVDIGIVSESNFPVNLALESSFSFYTKIFLESIPDKFLDQKPMQWFWQKGSREVPIIISSNFLQLYNHAFALSQGFPQLSDSGIQSLAFDLNIGPVGYQETYSAHVVGFSNRINSILVPGSFIDYANQKFGLIPVDMPSRLILTLSDPSNKSFYQFLKRKNYQTNFEALKWDQLRTVLEIMNVLLFGIVALAVIFYFIIVVLSLYRFIDLANNKLKLLSELGYNPEYLRKILVKRISLIVWISLIIAGFTMLLTQWIASIYIVDLHLELPIIPSYFVWLITGFITLSLLVFSRIIITKNS